MDTIFQHAQECLDAPSGVNFENKIVLSIAIRLRAEQFMVEKINDSGFTSSITTNQTHHLLAEFQRRFSSEEGKINAIKRVILMTPENIHLNSFMYEPIIDMSDDHLKQLYREVLSLA